MRLIVAISLAIMALLTVLTGLAGPAGAAPHCVAPGGAGGCFSTIQAAIDTATDGDTVNVVAGTYSENIVITKSLTLLGGFADSSLTSRTPRSSTIDGNGVGVVISITHNANVTVSGFTITGGNGTTNNGAGGGISVDTATATIVDNLIEDNVASSDPALGGDGGGIYATRSTVVISGNTIQFNRAYSATTGSEYGAGGGISIGSDNNEATLINNQILANTAAYLTASSTSAMGFGGGINCNGSKLVVEGNTIRNNLAISAGLFGIGGGINVNRTLAVTLTNNLIVENTAILTGTQFAVGGGISAGGDDGTGRKLVLSGNWIISNTAAVSLTGSGQFAGGGGVNIFGDNSADDSLTMQNNHLIGNVAAHSITGTGSDVDASSSEGGGLQVVALTTVVISNNEVRGNTAIKSLSLSGSGGWGGSAAGGGISLYGNDTVTVTGNDIYDNIAARQQMTNGVDTGTDGGGLRLGDNQTVIVSSNTISGNTTVLTGSLTSDAGHGYYPGGGGVDAGCWNLPTCNLSFVGNTFSNNLTAQFLTIDGSNANGSADGSLKIAEARATLTQNRFLNNQAATQDEFNGAGALWIWESVVTSTNNIFAGNVRGAGASGDTTPSQVKFVNDTFYNNGEIGIEAGGTGTTVSVTNTIVYGHQQGFNRYLGSGADSAFLYSDYNLLNNVDNYEDATPGTHDILNQDPKFVAAANKDFHLAADSPAINKGTSSGAPSVDFEGDPRPQEGSIDIGADEYRRAGGQVYLPLVIK